MAHASEEVTKSYKDIVTTLKTNLHWSVMGLDQLRGNSGYVQAYKNKMSGWQTNKLPPNGKLFTIPNLMDAQSLRRMEPGERDARSWRPR